MARLGVEEIHLQVVRQTPDVVLRTDGNRVDAVV